jgi:hypothetical protein
VVEQRRHRGCNEVLKLLHAPLGDGACCVGGTTGKALLSVSNSRLETEPSESRNVRAKNAVDDTHVYGTTHGRVSATEFEVSDVDAVQEYLGDPEVMSFVEPPLDRMAVERFIVLAGNARPPLVFAVEALASRQLIGHVIFHLSMPSEH